MLLAQPLQIDREHHQRVEHDEHRPKVEVEPLKRGVIPLAQIEQRDDADDIQGLHKKEASHNGDDFVPHRCGEGHHASYQNHRRLDAVATCLDRYRKAGCRVSQDAPLGNDRVIKGQNDDGAKRRQ